MFDFSGCERAVELGLFVEDASAAGEAGAFFAGDFGNSPAGGEVSTEDLEVAGGFDGVGEGADDDLVLPKGGEGGDVFGKGTAGDGGDGAVEERGGAEEFLDGRHTADLI